MEDKAWPENIREEEIPKIAEMKERLEKDGLKVNWKVHSDHTLKRFLRARGGDVDKGYEMFRNHLNWRKERKVDKILKRGRAENENIDKLEHYWPGQIHKVDKEGSPVYIERLGPVDVKGLVNTVPAEKIVHYQIYTQEKDFKLMQDMSKKAGKQIEKVLMIEDLDGVGWSHVYTPAVSLYQEILKMADANYPETLKKYIVINPPLIFSLVYKMMTPFVDPRTLAKVVVISGGKDEIQRVLLEHIDAENLPEEYGGTCKCEGGCIPAGGDYAPYNFREDGSPINPVSVDIGRKSTHELRVKVPNERSKLSWEFSTKSHDIGFTVHHEEEGEVIELQRYEAEVKGEHVVEKAGTYVLKWDNSHSTLRSKTVTYAVVVDHAAEEAKEEKKKKKKKKKEKKEKKNKGGAD